MNPIEPKEIKGPDLSVGRAEAFPFLLKQETLGFDTGRFRCRQTAGDAMISKQ